MELSIDTSTAVASVALSQNGETVSEATWSIGQDHSAELLPAVQHQLRQAQAALSSMTALFVAIGPGSYNGVRVALSTAKGLAFSLGIPLVGVSTLAAEAYGHAYTGLPVCAIHDAGRHEVAAARYHWKGEWLMLEPEHITTVGAVASATTSKTIFCGELPDALVQQLQQELGELAVVPHPAARVRRAGYLAALGWARLEKGQTDDVAALQPLYLRRPHITISGTKC